MVVERTSPSGGGGGRGPSATSSGASGSRTATTTVAVVGGHVGVGGLLLEDLATHGAASLRGLGADPVGDAVHVEDMLALADDCKQVSQYRRRRCRCKQNELADGAVVARILALGARTLEDDATDAADVVATWWKSPLPLGDGVVALDGDLHVDEFDVVVFADVGDATINVCTKRATAGGCVFGAAGGVCVGVRAEGS